MNRVMTYQNLRNFAYVNDQICIQPFKGIVISFSGLNGMDMYDTDPEAGRFYAEKGILYVVPYNNPWAWMNKQAVQFTDEIIDVLAEAYKLSDTIPIVSTGGSMGGQSALVYTKYAKRTPAACAANCPVCDLVFHYTERPDLPRTLYSAFYNEPGPAEEVLKLASPLHLANSMPTAAYHIFHCDADRSVNLDSHSKRFVSAMKEQGHRITFDIVRGRGHCDLTDEMKRKFDQYCVQAIEGQSI